MRNRFFILFMLLGILFSCAKVPITGRKQLSLLPEDMMLSMSFTSYKDFLIQNPPLAASDPKVQQVRNVGNRISDAVARYMKSQNLEKRLAGYAWEYNLVNDPTVNAWCMPGGKIVVYSGILPLTKDESGLAVVMGHEVSHAIARHGNERMSQQLAITFGAIGLDVAMQKEPQQTKDLFLTAYGVGSSLGMLAYSRQHEYEADKLGLVFMAMAGYDPERAVAFWQEMAKLNKAPVPEFLSTHPNDANRIAAIKAFLPEAKKYYKPS